MLRIKKDDLVMVITGKDKGKTARVLRVFPAEDRVLVEGLNLVKKAKRRTQQDPKGGVIPIEAPIHRSNLMLWDKQAQKPTRFKASIAKDGGKLRLSQKSGAAL